MSDSLNTQTTSDVERKLPSGAEKMHRGGKLQGKIDDARQHARITDLETTFEFTKKGKKAKPPEGFQSLPIAKAVLDHLVKENPGLRPTQILLEKLNEEGTVNKLLACPVMLGKFGSEDNMVWVPDGFASMARTATRVMREFGVTEATVGNVAGVLVCKLMGYRFTGPVYDYAWCHKEMNIEEANTGYQTFQDLFQ